MDLSAPPLPTEPTQDDPQTSTLELLRGIAEKQASLSGQNAMLNHQVSQLNQVVGACGQQMMQASRALTDELQKFKTGGPQRAMAAVFHKLFRELSGFSGQMDDLAHAASEAGLATEWLDALHLSQSRLETLLKSWGCVPIAIQVGQDEFDAELHESDTALPGEVPDGTPENIIVKVRRRGWRLHDAILSHPLVVVS